MIEIIPAIDLIDGKCVRLQQGDYQQKKVYNENPLEIAKQFEDYGIKRLHMVDLDGAKAKHVVNLRVLEQVASHTSLKIDFGGGIKTDKDISGVFNSGAAMATIGSIAVKDKELFNTWLQKYGSDKIILGADIKDRKIAISGWLDVTGIDLFDFLGEYEAMGVEHVLCTDISKDGMLQGAAIDLYLEIDAQFPNLKLIASGGISNMDEIYHLDDKGIFGVIIGKAFYEGKIKLRDLQKMIE
jgi:phosphoribosylformimino-5-aminoimidazole carboxamide ribotide isomerase